MNPALSTTQTAPAGLLGRLVARPWFWALVVLPIFAGALWRGLSAPAPTLPPVLGMVPPFALTNERGEPFGTQQLAGKPYIANFIFTSCTLACPRLTGEMLKLQHRTRNLGTGITLVSFSVDPAHDTPAVLAEYAKENGAVPGRWFFLTGPLEQITKTTVEGFKIALGPDEVFGTFHGEKFVLVDGRGQIRGYYDADSAGEDAIVRDVGLLANFPGQ